MVPTIGERMAAVRRRAIVGRVDELATLRDFLAGDQVIAYVHGPGGVGKTTLLDALAVDPALKGRPLRQVDCADLDPTTAAFQSAIGAPAGGSVLFVDRFEVLEPLVPWLWRTWLPTLPVDVKVVVAGRRPPPELWRQDPAFADLARVVPVRNLSPDAASDLARSRGIQDEAYVRALVRSTHGHPLAIVIASDSPTTATPKGSGVLLDHPDVAARLLGHFLDESVTPRQREALQVCGHARRVDRHMLAEVLRLDHREADELLGWVRARPYAESHPDGLTLHDVVRDALDHDLRWRDRAAFRGLHIAIRDVVLERIAATSGVEQHRWAMDLVYLHRGNATAQNYYALGDTSSLLLRPMRVDDPDEMAWYARIIDESEGRGDAVPHWLPRSDQRLVFEDSMGARVASSMWLRLDQVDQATIAADPALPGMLAAIEERRPPEPGEVMLHLTFAQDGFDHELQRQMTDQLAATCLYTWRAPRLGWVVFCSRHPELYAPVWEYIGFEDAGTRNGYSVWVRDFARYPFADWLTAMIDTELDEAGTLLPPVPSPVALSRADFGPAVRALLRDLHAPDRLRRNPLLDSRLAVPGDPVLTLTQRVQQAVDQLAQAPRLDVAARAIVRTFLRPAGSQENAAEMLGVPFSTYRRHLANGVERLEALLWDWELHGPPPLNDN